MSLPEPIHPRPPSAPSPQKTPSPHTDVMRRLLTAAVLIPYVLYAVAQGGLWVLGTVVVIVLLGIREFYQLIAAKGADPIWGFGLAAGAALPVVTYFGNEYHATILMTAALLALMVAQLGKAQISHALASISGTFFGVFYVGWLLSHAVVLRNFHDVVASKWGSGAAGLYAPESGAFLLIFVLTAVVGSDAGAYFAGRAWGKRKLAPTISPGKTIEGALGGMAFGMLCGLACKALFDFVWPALSQPLPYIVAAPLAIALAVLGICGDLMESLLKRDAEIKDAGALLPGMGGVLDRVDSALLAIPVMYYGMLALTYLRMGLR